jgi:hypothetical protein
MEVMAILEEGIKSLVERKEEEPIVGEVISVLEDLRHGIVLGVLAGKDIEKSIQKTEEWKPKFEFPEN